MPRIFPPLVMILSVILAALVTIACSIPIIIIGLIKLLLPIAPLSRTMSSFTELMMYYWCEGLAWLLRLNPHLTWDIQGLEGLSKKNGYMLICNHRSWADIVILCVLFRKYIPMNKYFLKQQLAWVPFLGLACWALGMPFMRRYSRAYLLRHPECRGKDIDSTRRSCLKFRNHPTTIVNFVEGSRFTYQKSRLTHSPFKKLLVPKAAGIAIALNILGRQFNKLLNVTLCYPENDQSPFYDMLSGRMTRITVRISQLTITDDLRGDYLNDKNFKRHFQLWLNDLWEEKDQLLIKLYQERKPPIA